MKVQRSNIIDIVTSAKTIIRISHWIEKDTTVFTFSISEIRGQSGITYFLHIRHIALWTHYKYLLGLNLLTVIYSAVIRRGAASATPPRG